MEGNEVFYDYIAVVDKEAKEVLACVPIKDGAEGFIKDGIGLKFYGLGAEPVFREHPGRITLEENATFYKSLAKS